MVSICNKIIKEELLLIEGIEKFGFGNWHDISEHMGSKSPSEIESHYETQYLSNKNYFPNKSQLLTQRLKNNKLNIKSNNV